MSEEVFPCLLVSSFSDEEKINGLYTSILDIKKKESLSSYSMSMVELNIVNRRMLSVLYFGGISTTYLVT